VGLGFDLLKPNLMMQIIKIDPGSPADATGKLKKGQYVESINGKMLRDEDPRVILGNIITEAEAIDSLVKLMVKDDKESKAYEVVVKLPVMGSFSDTSPLNCEKSEKIIRNFADFLAIHPKGWGSAMFLLSTGEEKDLEAVRGWMQKTAAENKDKKELIGSRNNWGISYTGPALCEYFLRTGDEAILHTIQLYADHLKNMIENDAFRGDFVYYSQGSMNAANVHCLTFLLLAKECGADVDEYVLQKLLKFFYRYAGHNNVAYGDQVPEGV